MKNVLTEEMKRTASIIADMINTDGAAKDYINGTNEDRDEFCKAYLQAWKKKVEKIQTTLMTNPEAKERFVNFVARL